MKFNLFDPQTGNLIKQVNEPIQSLSPDDKISFKIKFDKEYDFNIPLNYSSGSTQWGNPTYPLFIPTYTSSNVQGGSIYQLQSPCLYWQINGSVWTSKFDGELLYKNTIISVAQTVTLADGTKFILDTTKTYQITISSTDDSLFYWQSNKTPQWQPLTAAVTIYPYQQNFSIYKLNNDKSYKLLCVVIFVGFNIATPNNAYWGANVYDFSGGVEPEWDNNFITGDIYALDNKDTDIIYTCADNFYTEIPGTDEVFANNEFPQGTFFSGDASLISKGSIKDMLFSSYNIGAYSSYDSYTPPKFYNTTLDNRMDAMNSINPSLMNLSTDRITPLRRYTWNQFNGKAGCLNYIVPSNPINKTWKYLGGGRIEDGLGNTYNCLKLDFIDVDWRTRANRPNSMNSWADNLVQYENISYPVEMYQNIIIVTDQPRPFPAPSNNNFWQYQYMVFLDTTYLVLLFYSLSDIIQGTIKKRVTFIKQPDISDWDTSKTGSMYKLFDASPFDSDISKWDVSNVRTQPANVFGDCPIRNEYKPKAWQTA